MQAPKQKRKSRKGVVITAHKGGRTLRRLAPLTPETAELLKGVLHAMGKGGKPMSFGDWVEMHIKDDHQKNREKIKKIWKALQS